MALNELNQLLPACITLARQAGAAILQYWQQPQSLQVQQKADKTPVTAADLAAHSILHTGLQTLTPQWPILSEEGCIPSYQQRRHWQRYWLLDPLDGTRGFVRGSGEFTVNIALIENHQPVLGVLYSPVTQTCYYAYVHGGAFKQEALNEPSRLIHTGDFKPPWRIAVGQFHRIQRLTEKLPLDWHYHWLRLNSSLKFGLLADGGADVYVRFGPTSEWDTAAGQCILQEVGGVTTDLKGNTLQYNQKASLLNPNFIALADASYLDQWLTLFSNSC